MSVEKIRTIAVPAGNGFEGYDISIGRGLLERAGEFIKKPVGKRAALISDSNVFPLYGERVVSSLKAAGYEVFTHVSESGEDSKSLETYGNILDFFSDSGITRGDFALALGGGVVGDLCGFAAATYLRGIGFAQLPTTLLAAVDSSVGGKTAINLKSGKNLAGAFMRPFAVICGCEALETLPKPVFAEGMAEAVKYGAICDGLLFDRISAGKIPLPELIGACVEIKLRIVAEDEFDRGNRQLLNLGHTFGHGIELASGYKIPHGRAVAAGLLMAARASELLGVAKEELCAPLAKALSANGLGPNASGAIDFGANDPGAIDPFLLCGFSPRELLPGMLRDKKRDGDEITLVLMEKIGAAVLKKIPAAELPGLVERVAQR